MAPCIGSAIGSGESRRISIRSSGSDASSLDAGRSAFSVQITRDFRPARQSNFEDAPIDNNYVRAKKSASARAPDTSTAIDCLDFALRLVYRRHEFVLHYRVFRKRSVFCGNALRALPRSARPDIDKELTYSRKSDFNRLRSIITATAQKNSKFQKETHEISGLSSSSRCGAKRIVQDAVG